VFHWIQQYSLAKIIMVDLDRLVPYLLATWDEKPKEGISDAHAAMTSART
jgi:hypothetical protein